jgi:nitrogen fixation protein NifX
MSLAECDAFTGTAQDKVIPKLDFVEGCAASTGASPVRRLKAQGVQPIVVDNKHDIVDLPNEATLALAYGGLAWVERAKAKAAKAPAKVSPPTAQRMTLMHCLEDLEQTP